MTADTATDTPCTVGGLCPNCETCQPLTPAGLLVEHDHHRRTCLGSNQFPEPAAVDPGQPAAVR